MSEELQRSLRAIHDLERATRLWELVRDDAQQVIDESDANPENQGDSIETDAAVVKARGIIAACNTYIIAAKTRIGEVERGS